MRMSYSGNTLAFQAKARGSIPLIRFQHIQYRVKNGVFNYYDPFLTQRSTLYNNFTLLKSIFYICLFHQLWNVSRCM